MHFKSEWWDGMKKIQSQPCGIERLVGTILHFLNIFLLSFWMYLLAKWIYIRWKYIRFGTRERPQSLSWVIDLYVCGALVLSILIFYWRPSECLAWVSAVSGSTLLVLVNVVLLSKVLGDIESPERSLILFMCNLAQIVFMYATWYHLKGAYAQDEALLKSVLVLGTVGYPDKTPTVATIAQLQIATDIILLAIFLGHLAGRRQPPWAYYQTGVIATG